MKNKAIRKKNLSKKDSSTQSDVATSFAEYGTNGMQVFLSTFIVMYIFVIPFVMALFLDGDTYIFKLVNAMSIVWYSPFAVISYTFICIAIVLFIDGLKIKYKKRPFQTSEPIETLETLKVTSTAPVFVMQSSLKGCTNEQALEMLKKFLLENGATILINAPSENGFLKVEELDADASFGIQLIAKSKSGKFAFMIGGLASKLTMTDIEKLAIGRAYFECADAICIATDNATIDAQKKALDLHVPYLNGDYFTEELKKYFSKSSKVFV